MKDYDKLLDLNFYKPIRIPSIVKKYLAQETAKDAALNAKIYDEIYLLPAG